VNAIFLHDYPLAVEPGSTPRPLVQKKLGEILYVLICSSLPCLSWLLRSRVRKSRRDLWITLYNNRSHLCFIPYWYIETREEIQAASSLETSVPEYQNLRLNILQDHNLHIYRSENLRLKCVFLCKRVEMSNVQNQFRMAGNTANTYCRRLYQETEVRASCIPKHVSYSVRQKMSILRVNEVCILCCKKIIMSDER